MQQRKRQYKRLLILREAVRKNIRILNFKRPKWRYIKKDLKWNILNRKFFRGPRRRIPLFKNQLRLHTPLDWVRIRFFYKRFLLAKIRFFKFYDLKVSVKSLRKLFLDSTSIYNFLIKFEYRLDVVLWRVGFFENPTQSRFYISQGFIFINGQTMKSYSYILKKGDLVQISPYIRTFIFRNFRIRNRLKDYLNPLFFECNYNTFEILVLNNPKEKYIPRLSYMYPKFLDLQGLRNYLK